MFTFQVKVDPQLVAALISSSKNVLSEEDRADLLPEDIIKITLSAGISRWFLTANDGNRVVESSKISQCVQVGFISGDEPQLVVNNDAAKDDAYGAKRAMVK